jgi:EAL domain-containing protein (putative c-di-GMP-specific phosphodiesterase class I)
LTLEAPLCLAEQLVDLGAGIGMALAPEHAGEADDLIALAERAMETAKRRMAGSLMFRPEMDARSAASLGLLTELRRAVEADELRLFLQPKLDLRERRIRAAEALVRWQHPTRGMVPPYQFIPFAEQTGFIREISAWVLRAAAGCAAQACAAGQPLRISVNLSTRDLLDVDLPAKVQALVSNSGCGADSLCLEITESAIMDDPKRALETAKALHAAGFKLSIDDFGTGYSSLAYLKQLPVQELKIDQSFVFGMAGDEGDRKIVKSTIELAHNLGLKVVAEGIEDEATLELLALWGCDEGQGYFIAKPMPAAELLQQLSLQRLQ